MADRAPSIEGVVFITHSPYGSDNTLTSIDLATGSKATLELWNISHENALALSPLGDTVITAQGYHGISFNDTSTMTSIHRLDCNGGVCCVAWSLDGQYIAAGTRSGEVNLINPSTRSIIKNFKSHRYSARTVSFNRTSDKLVAGTFDHRAYIYAVPDLTVLTTLRGLPWAIPCSLFLHDDRVVIGSSDGTIRVWDSEGNTINIIEGHSGCVHSLAVSPDGKVSVSGAYKGNLCIYDTDTYELTASINCDGPVYSLCFINSNIVLAGINDSGMIAVDVQTGEVIKKYDGQYKNPSIAIRVRPERPIVSGLFI